MSAVDAIPDVQFAAFLSALQADPLRMRRARSEQHRPLPRSVCAARAFTAETDRLRKLLPQHILTKGTTP